jgi:uncharacterized cupin superfamily protein
MVSNKMVSGDINNMRENPIKDSRLKRLSFKQPLLHFLLAYKSVFETQNISSDKQLKNVPTLQQGTESVTSAMWSFTAGKSVYKIS